MSVLSTSVTRNEFSWNHKRLWLTATVPFVILLVLSGCMNYIVDPFGLYGTGIYPPVAFSQYEHKLRLFREYVPRPRALVIGSSRVECINPELVEEITGRRCFNWANPLAKTELFYAELRIALEEYNAPLDLVIVGVEPDVFHPQADAPPQALTIYDYTRYIFDKPAYEAAKDKIGRLFSVEQTAASLRVLSGTSDYNALEEYRFDANGYMRVTDYGSLTDDMIVRGLENELRDYPEDHWGNPNFSNLNPDRKIFWEDFLRICHERGIMVYACMTPLAPELLRRIYELEGFDAEALYTEVREYLEETVGEVGGVFRDYTDVTSFDGDPEGFIDVMHLKPENGEIMLRHLLGDDFQNETEVEVQNGDENDIGADAAP